MPQITRRGGLVGAVALPVAGAQTARAAGSALTDGAAHVPLNGVDHWYRIAGAANRSTPLIIVHGGPGGNAYVYERLQGPWLEKRRTVVYYDQRGGGRSGAPRDPADYAMTTLVADLDALIRRLGVAQVDLLGFSSAPNSHWSMRSPTRSAWRA